MEPSTSGAGPVGNKRNSIKKLLDAYHDLIGGENGAPASPSYPGMSDGQGGPGIPTPAKPAAGPQKPMLPGLGGGPMPGGSPQMPAGPMPMPQMQPPGAPMPGGMPGGQPPMPPQQPQAPQAPKPMPNTGAGQGIPPQQPTPTPAPGMKSSPEQDIENMQKMYSRFTPTGATQAAAGAATPGMGMMGKLGGAISGGMDAMKGAAGDMAGGMGGMAKGALSAAMPGISGAMKGAEMGGNLLKTITEHLQNSRQSHMDHEKEILQEVIKAAKERGGGAPDSMKGHEQDYFDQTSGGGNTSMVKPAPKKNSKPKSHPKPKPKYA